MKIKDYKCTCGKDDFFFADKGKQKGIFCSYCGRWLKWADKNEQNLAMRSVQLSVIDDIKEEMKVMYRLQKCEYNNAITDVFNLIDEKVRGY